MLYSRRVQIALVVIFLLALVVLVWPSPSAPEEKKQEVYGELELGRAPSEVELLDRELVERSLAGRYEGRVEIDSLELVAKNFLVKIPVARAREDLEKGLEGGFLVAFTLEEDGSWELDLGETFSQYRITSLVSTTTDRVDFEDGLIDIKREFYIAELDDKLYLKLRGHVLDYVGGTLILEGENKMMKLSVLGSFKLDKLP